MKNGKLFGKISVIDLAVIALIVLLLSAAVIRVVFFPTPDKAIQGTEKGTYEQVEREITLSIANVSKQLLSDPLEIGDTLMISNKVFGEVTHLERVPYTDTYALEDGTTVTVNLEYAYTYIVKVKATLLRKNGFLRTTTNDTVAVGKTLAVATEYFFAHAIVTDIQ